MHLNVIKIFFFFFHFSIDASMWSSKDLHTTYNNNRSDGNVICHSLLIFISYHFFHLLLKCCNFCYNLSPVPVFLKEQMQNSWIIGNVCVKLFNSHTLIPHFVWLLGLYIGTAVEGTYVYKHMFYSKRFDK